MWHLMVIGVLFSLDVFPLQMALDAKAIKEEIPDKDTYETTTRKVKGKIYDYLLLD